MNGVESKPCTKCGEVLPLERFSQQKRKDGVVRWMSQCKACRTAFEKERREAGLRVDKDPERKRRVADEWRKNNPEKSRMAVRRRRARLREVGGTVTVEEWENVLEAWGHRCAYCNVHAPGELSMDHCTPVARGGQHVVENVVPCCDLRRNNCNSRKGTLTSQEFMHGRKRPKQVV